MNAKIDMQKTIAKEFALEGIGLHTGNPSKITFKPAPVNYGIKFIRTDIPSQPVIPALFQYVSGTAIRGTTIGNETAKVHTVEHILAVFSGLGIDNVEIQLTNNEPPVLDGSAKLFAEEIKKAGIVIQDAPKEIYKIKEPCVYESEATKITAYPSDEFKIECSVSYDHPFLGNQNAEFTITEDTFVNEIASARTFCFDYEIEALKTKGLAKGGSLDNAIVVGISSIHNPDKKLRFPDEFVRHKILDLIGDLFLLGKPLKAHIKAVRCGHNHNINFVRELSKLVYVDKIVPKTQEVSGMTETLTDKIYDINAIQKIIPHRYPFLMIDKVSIKEDSKKAVGYKCVSGNENFFQGHFPGQPIMPGVLIVEAMAQTSCVLFLCKPEYKTKLAYFMAIDNVKFRKPVIPGDVLELRIEVIRAREKGGRVKGEAYVNNNLVTEAEFMFAIVDREG